MSLWKELKQMKDTLELQKFYPEEIVITEVTQNEKEIYIHVSVQSKIVHVPSVEWLQNINMVLIKENFKIFRS